MLTLAQAQTLYHGQTLYHVTLRNRDGSPMRVRKSGAVKVWKRTGEWRMPVKYGLYESGYIGTRGTGATSPECANPENWTLFA
jgi:hypothetical protein